MYFGLRICLCLLFADYLLPIFKCFNPNGISADAMPQFPSAIMQFEKRQLASYSLLPAGFLPTLWALPKIGTVGGPFSLLSRRLLRATLSSKYTNTNNGNATITPRISHIFEKRTRKAKGKHTKRRSDLVALRNGNASRLPRCGLKYVDDSLKFSD